MDIASYNYTRISVFASWYLNQLAHLNSTSIKPLIIVIIYFCQELIKPCIIAISTYNMIPH